MVELLEAPTSVSTKRCTRPGEKMVTDLYEIISAVQDSLEAGDEALLIPTVMRILRSGQATFVRDLKAQEN